MAGNRRLLPALVSYDVTLANVDSIALPASGTLVESVQPEYALIVGTEPHREPPHRRRRPRAGHHQRR